MNVLESNINVMSWKPLKAALHGVQLPESVSLTQLHRQEVPELVARIRGWYPDIKVGAESVHWNESFYYDQVHIQDCPGDRNIYGIVVRFQGKLVGYLSAEKSDCIRADSVLPLKMFS